MTNIEATAEPLEQRLGALALGSGTVTVTIKLRPVTGTRTFEAGLVLECRKIYSDDIDPARFLDPSIAGHYPQKDYHRIYFGEIVAIAATGTVFIPAPGNYTFDVDSDDGFNPLAKSSVDLTRRALSEASLSYLAALPQGPILVDPTVEICHGSPFDEDTYVHQEMDVLEALAASQRPVCLFGHTHVPFAATGEVDGELEILLAGDGKGNEIPLEGGRRYVVNPGSVGQPRDGDPRAAYGVVDTGTLTIAIRRVAYPVERARDRIIAAGFPRQLGQRLLVGR